MHSKQTQKYFSNILLIFFIFIFCFFLAISNTHYSSTIDEALLISNKVTIPDNNSPQLILLKKSITIVSYLQSLLLKLDLDIFRISQITLLISSLFFFSGIYLVVLNLLKSVFSKNLRIVSFLFTVLVFIFDSHLPHTDYPNAFFSDATSGIFSIALSTLIFGLIAGGKNKSVVFFSILLIFIHPIQGLWISGILLLTYILIIFLSEKKITYKKIKRIIFIFFILTTVFLYYFFSHSNSFVSINEDRNLLEVWLNNWETHRNNITFNFNYLKITSLLFLICVIYIFIFKRKNKNLFNFFLSLGLTSSISSLIYILYKIFYTSLPLFIITPMPTRFINTHSMIAYPVILMSGLILVKFISDYLKINKNLPLMIVVIIFSLFTLFDHRYKSLNERFNSIYKNRFESVYNNFFTHLINDDKKKYTTKFWNEFREAVNAQHYTLVTRTTENKSYRFGLKPYILKPTSFDYVFYSPSSIDQTIKILEEIYDLDFFNDNLVEFTEDHIKTVFENKKNDDWKKIYKNFNVKYVFVPHEWEINLKIKLKNEKFTLYEIE